MPINLYDLESRILKLIKKKGNFPEYIDILNTIHVLERFELS